MSLIADVLEMPIVYRLWQAPFERRKLQPVIEHNDLHSARRVLDVGCGPGTSASYFDGAEYLGLDINARYVEYARRRYRKQFHVQDATTLADAPVLRGARFDFILINSLLHHLSDTSARRVLEAAAGYLDADGHVHLLELVLPSRASVALVLARADRGKFARSAEGWRSVCEGILEPVIVSEYQLRGGGVTLWNMIYVKGRRL